VNSPHGDLEGGKYRRKRFKVGEDDGVHQDAVAQLHYEPVSRAAGGEKVALAALGQNRMS